MMSTAIESFREQFVTAKVQFGSFIRTPSPHVVELIGAVGFDFVVIDEEHGPFDRRAIDIALSGMRATGIPTLTAVSC
jgi:staphyloferrin B biosynthesis citrate synthase